MFRGAAGTMGVCPPGYLASLPANRAVHGSQRYKIHSVRICGLVDLLGRGDMFAPPKSNSNNG